MPDDNECNVEQHRAHAANESQEQFDHEERNFGPVKQGFCREGTQAEGGDEPRHNEGGFYDAAPVEHGG